MEKLRDKIIHGDCIKILGKVDVPFADLIFADPPFNIGYKYNQYNDRVGKDSYVDWTRRWMTACCNALKPNGSFFIAIGDEHAADIKKTADDLRLYMRNWIIWHYTFGQQMKRKFARSHTHILYFVKDKDSFKFNSQSVRIISDRQKIYNDKRANPAGKMPDDVWNEYPRLCGTFNERVDFPCQMPESLLARIIRVSTDEKDWVLDPFIGSGTTAVVAKKLNRFYTGIDVSQEYAQAARQRVKKYQVLAAKSTPVWTQHLDDELKCLYQENKVGVETLTENKHLKRLFAEKFNLRIGAKEDIYGPDEIIQRLMVLDKTAKLGPAQTRGPGWPGWRWFLLFLSAPKKKGPPLWAWLHILCRLSTGLQTYTGLAS